MAFRATILLPHVLFSPALALFVPVRSHSGVVLHGVAVPGNGTEGSDDSNSSLPDLDEDAKAAHEKALARMIKSEELDPNEDLPKLLKDQPEFSALEELDKLKDFFVFAGQSNCVGLAHVQDLDKTKKNMPEEALISYGISGHGFNHYLSGRSVFGPDVPFLQKIVDDSYRNEYVGVLKRAKGNTNLDKDWSFRSSLFTDLIHQTNKAKLSSICKNGKCKAKALIWIQGEADACDEDMADRYYDNLQNFTASYRQWSGEHDIPIIIVQLPPRGALLKECATGLAKVREAQKKVVKNGKHMALVSTDDVEQFKDSEKETSLHYNAGGMVTLGEKLVKAYKAI